METFLRDEQWERIEPLLPKERSKGTPMGRQPPSYSKASFGCLRPELDGEMCKNISLWKHMLEAVTNMGKNECVAGNWRVFLRELDERGRLDWSESFGGREFCSR